MSKKRLGRIIAAVGLVAVLCIMLTACVGPIGRNQDPVANFTTDQEDGTFKITFDGDSSFDLDGEVVLWNWDFGDGEEASGETVTHPYASSGTYPVQLLVQDNDGAHAEVAKDVTVAAIVADPVASFSPYYCGVQPQTGSTICFSGTGSYDPDGWITWGYWSFGDGSMVDGSWTQWVGGTEFSVMREVTHTYTKLGLHAVILVIFDNDGKSASTSRIITVR